MKPESEADELLIIESPVRPNHFQTSRTVFERLYSLHRPKKTSEQC